MNRNDKAQFTSDRELSEQKELFDEYAGWISTHMNRDTTITRRKKGAEEWLHWCEETGHDPLEADEDTVRSFVQRMAADDLADTTISNRFASISKFYHWLVTDPSRNSHAENPTAEIDLPKDYEIGNRSEYVSVLHREGRQDIIAPSYTELKPLFEHIPGKTDFSTVRNELICRLFWQTALRSDELSRVRLNKVKTEEREIEVRSSKLDREKHPELYHRKVFYEPSLDYLLHRWFDKRKEKDPDGSNPYLLIGSKGKQLSPPYLSRTVKRAAHNAGIQEPLVTESDGSVKQWLYTGHRLRHARITHLCNHTDMDLNFVRMMAGHVKVETTLQYVNADWTEARNAYREATEPGR